MDCLDKNVALKAGERFHLADGERLALIESGKVEVYAVTRTEGSFRQQFLVALTADGAAFPSLDEFEQTETLLYALEDTQIKIFDFNEVAVEDLRKLYAALVRRADKTAVAWTFS